MARTKLKPVFLVIGLLVSPFSFKGQCGDIKGKEMNFIVFPEVYFSSDADQVNNFLSSSGLLESKFAIKENQRTKSSYKFVNTSRLTWEEAANACGSIGEGVHLAFIESEQENREVFALAQGVIGEGLRFWWMGLNDKKTEGIWQWYNASAGYANWQSGEPNSYRGKDEDCGMITFKDGDNAVWWDGPCDWTLNFICESDIEIKF
ncbi:Brevican core protein [Holothuria leucospilota]|uniref:Brevican core protein n=1 Tax=Holothuria leucospilota TaxID=206669 RepID=A0A9Q1C8N6_HOLLE|nr:Brevican core protein [Holothuria leucospilota]